MILVGEKVIFQQTSAPVSYGLNVSVTPSPATVRVATTNSKKIQPAAATVVVRTVDPTIPNNPPLGIGSMTIGTTFQIG